MEHASFDELARIFSAPSRRSLLFGSVALGLLLDRPISPEALARKRKKKRKKKKRKPASTGCQDETRPCGSKCLTADQCCDNSDCDPGQSCNEANACVCQRQCGGVACGDDGCGGSCGTCRAGDTCQGGACACSTPGALGPGDFCGSASECCPYTDVERSCDRGSGSCSSAFAACRYGLGGKCFGNCDCLGDLECRGDTCLCPGDRDYLGNGLCCGEGLTRCGDRCCQPGTCDCTPFVGCRCTTPPF
jgi:hypothetical protein